MRRCRPATTRRAGGAPARRGARRRAASTGWPRRWRGGWLPGSPPCAAPSRPHIRRLQRRFNCTVGALFELSYLSHVRLRTAMLLKQQTVPCYTSPEAHASTRCIASPSLTTPHMQSWRAHTGRSAVRRQQLQSPANVSAIVPRRTLCALQSVQRAPGPLSTMSTLFWLQRVHCRLQQTDRAAKGFEHPTHDHDPDPDLTGHHNFKPYS